MSRILPSERIEKILDAALVVDVASGTSTFVPIIVECASTRFSSTVNFVGFSTLQCTILHAVVFRNVALFQTFCAKLGDLDLEDRHCHYCGKNSETPLLRCAECRIATKIVREKTGKKADRFQVVGVYAFLIKGSMRDCLR